MFQSITIGRPFGIRTSIHWSFWLLPAFILLSGFLSGGLPMAVIDTFVVLAVFGCVALHELGHALAGRQFGVRTRDITLYPIGGVATLERIPRSPWAEIAIALAGPAVNVAIVALFAPLMWFDGYSFGLRGHMTAIEIFWTRVLWANVGLVLFNMIPAFPMDGGRVLRALMSWFFDRATATEIAAAVGTGFAVLFAIVGVLPGGNPMLLILAAFLFMTGQSELNAVRYEEAQRRSPRRANVFDFPNAASTYRPDGWEYDPQSRMWTYWHNGIAMKRVRAMG